MNSTTAYEQRRNQIEHYFDRTAADAWARLTSNAPVGRIRATVRAGRDTMRETLLSWLPRDLRGKRVLDAGCGTGALALQAALDGPKPLAALLRECADLLIALQRPLRLMLNYHCGVGALRTRQMMLDLQTL